MENNKPQFQTFKINDIQFSKQKIREAILQKVEAHKIRLTPSEVNILVEQYIHNYITNIDVSSLVSISEGIIKRN